MNYVFFLFLICFIVLILFYQFLFYQYKTFFSVLEEGFVQLNENYTKQMFDEDATMIQNTIQKQYPSIKIDKSIDGNYFQRIWNRDIVSYKNNNRKKYEWDEKTNQLYNEFLEKQGYFLNSVDFVEHTNKMKTVYNQFMILELLSNKTEQGQLLQHGLLINEQNEIVKPLLQDWREYYNNSLNDINLKVLKCSNNQLKQYDKNDLTKLEKGKNVSSQLFDSSIEYKKEKCNPCDITSPPNICQYKIKFKGNYNDQLFEKVWQSTV